MNKISKHYLVGIDLGTTHTVVAYAAFNDPEKHIHLFEIPQLIAPGEVADRPLLPSVRYHPAIGELSADSGFLNTDDGAVLGEAARILGAKTQGRLVTSAKSWLSHTAVDHAAAICLGVAMSRCLKYRLWMPAPVTCNMFGRCGSNVSPARLCRNKIW